MTKKDFEKWARYIREHPILCYYEKVMIAEAVINLNDNPRFDKDRFVKACGLERAF